MKNLLELRVWILKFKIWILKSFAHLLVKDARVQVDQLKNHTIKVNFKHGAQSFYRKSGDDTYYTLPLMQKASRPMQNKLIEIEMYVSKYGNKYPTEHKQQGGQKVYSNLARCITAITIGTIMLLSSCSVNKYGTCPTYTYQKPLQISTKQSFPLTAHKDVFGNKTYRAWELNLQTYKSKRK